MELPTFLVLEDDTGYIGIKGHRIGLAHVMREYAAGSSAEMIWARFPSLALATIHKVIVFYLENRSEVDAYVAKDDALLLEQQLAADRTHKVPSLPELRERFEKMRPAAG